MSSRAKGAAAAAAASTSSSSSQHQHQHHMSMSPASPSLISDRPKRGNHKTQRAIEAEEQATHYKRRRRASTEAPPSTTTASSPMTPNRISRVNGKHTPRTNGADDDEGDRSVKSTRRSVAAPRGTRSSAAAAAATGTSKPSPSPSSPSSLATSASPLQVANASASALASASSPPPRKYNRKHGTEEVVLRWVSPPGSTADIDSDNIIVGGRSARRLSRLPSQAQTQDSRSSVGDFTKDTKPKASADVTTPAAASTAATATTTTAAKKQPHQRRASEPAPREPSENASTARLTRGRASAIAPVPAPAPIAIPTPPAIRRTSQRISGVAATADPSSSSSTESSGLSSPLLEVTDSSDDDEASSSTPLTSAGSSVAATAAASSSANKASTQGKKKASAAPKWKRKVFLTAGLYSPDFKIDGSNGTIRNGRLSARGVLEPQSDPAFPEPVFFGRDLLTGQREFSLPYPLLEQSDELRARIDAKRKPPPYRQIDKNRYTSRPKLKGELPLCQCDPSSNCGDDCLNRLLQFVCNPKVCPCGDKCTNVSLGKRPRARCDTAWYGERGFGLKTLDDIPKGGLVDEYRGEVINLAEAARRVNEFYKDTGNFYFLDYDAAAGEVLDGGLRGNITRFANHSCNPNCYIEKWLVCGTDEERTAEFQVGLFALRDIAAGEELTYDYGWSAFANKQVAGAAPAIKERCYCGAPNCCGVLGGKKNAANANSASASASTSGTASPAPAASSSSSSLVKRALAGKNVIHAKKSSTSRAAQVSNLAVAAQKTASPASVPAKRPRASNANEERVASSDDGATTNVQRPRRSTQPTAHEPVILSNSPPSKKRRQEQPSASQEQQQPHTQPPKKTVSITTPPAATSAPSSSSSSSSSIIPAPSSNAATPAAPPVAASSSSIPPPSSSSSARARLANALTSMAAMNRASASTSASASASTSNNANASTSRGARKNGLPTMPGPLSSDAAGRLLAAALGGRPMSLDADMSWLTVPDSEAASQADESSEAGPSSSAEDTTAVAAAAVAAAAAPAIAAALDEDSDNPNELASDLNTDIGSVGGDSSDEDDYDSDDEDWQDSFDSRDDDGGTPFWRKGRSTSSSASKGKSKATNPTSGRIAPHGRFKSKAPRRSTYGGTAKFSSKRLGPDGLPLWPLGKPDIGKDGQPVRYNPANREARGAIKVKDYPPGTKFFLADGRPIDTADVDEASQHRYIYSEQELEEKAKLRRDKNAESARIRRLRKKYEETGRATSSSATPGKSATPATPATPAASSSTTPATAQKRRRSSDVAMRDAATREQEREEEAEVLGSLGARGGSSDWVDESSVSLRPSTTKAKKTTKAATTKASTKASTSKGKGKGKGKRAATPTPAVAAAALAMNGPIKRGRGRPRKHPLPTTPAPNGSSAAVQQQQQPGGPKSTIANGRAVVTTRKAADTAKAKVSALNGNGGSTNHRSGASSGGAAFQSAAAKAGSATRFLSRQSKSASAS